MDIALSVIIPAYNESACLPQTLEAIFEALGRFKQETGLESEVIVVDNDSNDATATVAHELGARVLPHANRNIAAVRNHGVRESHGHLLVTVDADSFVPRETFVDIWYAMQTGLHDGGGVRTGVKTDNRWMKFSYAAINQIILKRERVSLGLFFCERDAFNAIGGFPEEFLAGEDLAFARKLRDYSERNGKTYCNLQKVEILTLARKSAPLSETLSAYYHSAKIAFGFPVKKESLGYWYNPRR